MSAKVIKTAFLPYTTLAYIIMVCFLDIWGEKAGFDTLVDLPTRFDPGQAC